MLIRYPQDYGHVRQRRTALQPWCLDTVCQGSLWRNDSACSASEDCAVSRVAAMAAFTSTLP